MRPPLLSLLAAAGVLTGCASVPAGDAIGVARDWSQRVDGVAPAIALTQAQHDERRALRARLLAAPLDEAAAVRLALEASPAMQALLADAWQAQAAAAQSAAAPNPFFAFERIASGGEVDLTRTLGIGLTELLTLPARRDAAQRTVQGRQWQLARDVLAHTAAVRQQWVRAVAAQQLVAYHRQVQDAADASAELARRMQAVGNFSRLQRAREQAFLADATAQLARALAASTAEREALVRLLGLDADEAERLVLPERLADVPGQPRAADEVSRRAVEDRLDLRVARLELAAAERAQPLAAVAPWHVELAAVREAGGGETGRGFEIHLPLPVFDTGSARRQAASAQVLAARARFEQTRSEATSVLRERYVAYRTAHDLARHYRDEVVPLARTVTDEMLLKYNGMLVGVFELLADARAGASRDRRDRGAARLLARARRARRRDRRRTGGRRRARRPAGRESRRQGRPLMTTRRLFLGGAAVAAAAVGRAALAAVPEAAVAPPADTMAPPLQPSGGRPYRPVVTLNGWTLPWRMNAGWKEFHLVAEPVLRELAPGMTAQLWGYNGSSPGPTIEVVEGDRVRLFVTNRLPEHTAVHWHGQRLPSGMDGVGGLTQPQIPPGKTFVYEFEARRSGTFMYHPHADEMVQMAMGMMGFWVTHPKDPRRTPGYTEVDRDFCFLLNAFDIEPGSATPKIMTMLDFNLWCWNSRVFPGIDSLPVRLGDRVRIRVGNLTMTNHPIHMHGHEFVVAGTDGGWTNPASRWPEVTADIAVGQMRAIEFVATEPGDWAFHCHKSHHTMNAMGHDVPTMIGVDHRDVVHKIQQLVPDYMVMGERGMADMGEMEMPLPDNTLPMMTGQGPMGPLEMGGMFTVIKVREGLARDDYRDPGWYRHPRGTVAYEWTGASMNPARAPTSNTDGSEVHEHRGAPWRAVKPKGGHRH